MTAELEKRRDDALRALKHAEDGYGQQQQPALPAPLPPDSRERFQAVGQHLSLLWEEGIVAQAHKKALLRCLIDMVVMHRVPRDTVQARIVWKVGETTTLRIPIPVGSWSELTGAALMEQSILEQSAKGFSDEQIARSLSSQGYRSPLLQDVLPSTVRGVRPPPHYRRAGSQVRCRSPSQAHTTSTPDTTWAANRRLPDSSRDSLAPRF